jgi:hypothetical protein
MNKNILQEGGTNSGYLDQDIGEINYTDERTRISSDIIADRTAMGENNKFMIDNVHDRYPFCIVWTPLPLISWIIPIIGHTGICT